MVLDDESGTLLRNDPLGSAAPGMGGLATDSPYFYLIISINPDGLTRNARAILTTL